MQSTGFLIYSEINFRTNDTKVAGHITEQEDNGDRTCRHILNVIFHSVIHFSFS